MYIKSVYLEQFRCHNTYEAKFSEGINIIIGSNAAGKTSVVEGIHYLGIGKSHKTNNDNEVIKKGCSYSVVKGKIDKKPNEMEITVGITEKGKKIKRNELTLKSISEHIGLLNVVVFSPDDIKILKGSPQDRRHFIDSSLSQIDKVYLSSLQTYKRLLKERNEMIKQYKETNRMNQQLFDVISNELVKIGKTVIQKRETFISLLERYVLRQGEIISNNKEHLSIEYLPNTTVDNYEKDMKLKYGNDLLQKTTTTGPHRDDFVIKDGETNLAIFGSQGQIRTATLSLKLGLAKLLTRMNKFVAIVLDDVFSELDGDRQNNLIRSLDVSNQVFITTTSISDLSKELKEISNIIELNKGSE